MQVWFTIEKMLSVLLNSAKSVTGGRSSLPAVNIAKSVVKIYWWWSSIAVRFPINNDVDLLNNCVGIQNKRYYLLFLTYTSLTSSLMIYPLSLTSPFNNVTLLFLKLLALSGQGVLSWHVIPLPLFSVSDSLNNDSKSVVPQPFYRIHFAWIYEYWN